MTVCRHCRDPIMKFTFGEDDDQWWHANPPYERAVWRHCHRNPDEPVAEP